MPKNSLSVLTARPFFWKFSSLIRDTTRPLPLVDPVSVPGRVKPRPLCQELCSGPCARHAWEDQPRSGVQDCHQSSSQSQLPCQSELPYQLPCHQDKMSAGRRKKWNQENLSEKCSKTILTYHIRIRLTEVIPCCNFSSQLSCLSCKNLIYLIKWLGILMWFIFWMLFLCKKKTTIVWSKKSKGVRMIRKVVTLEQQLKKATQCLHCFGTPGRLQLQNSSCLIFLTHATGSAKVLNHLHIELGCLLAQSNFEVTSAKKVTSAGGCSHSRLNA